MGVANSFRRHNNEVGWLTKWRLVANLTRDEWWSLLNGAALNYFHILNGAL